MQRQIVAEEWCKFAAQTIPTEVSPEQRKAMRLAFYCGAEILLRALLDGFSPESPEPTTEDENLLKGVMIEMEMFAKQVTNGSW